MIVRALPLALVLFLGVSAGPGLAQDDVPTSDDIVSALLPVDLDGRSRIGARSIDGLFDPQGRGVKVIDGTEVPYIDLRVAFEFDSDVLSNDALLVLERLAVAFNAPELASSKFRIVGHTDARGSDAYNDDLSQRRAASVVQHLTRNLGVQADRLDVSFRGKREPLPDIDAEDERNRRVEIQNIGTHHGG
ncbi:MAG: OmpA family protein [Rhodobacteraceae bacterium]|jgi:outer membrane protein OmpA-like peptidoglycan-associated protein|nr:OmpA family protein [Paracoccaceae bacterium]